MTRWIIGTLFLVLGLLLISAVPTNAQVPPGEEIDICLLWQDREEEIPLTDEVTIRRCLHRPGRDLCEWEGRSDQSVAETAELAEQGFIRIDPDADPPLEARMAETTFEVKDLPAECEDLVAGILPGGAALSAAAKAGIGLGIAGVAAVLIDRADDDAEASPSRP